MKRSLVLPLLVALASYPAASAAEETCVGLVATVVGTGATTPSAVPPVRM